MGDMENLQSIAAKVKENLHQGGKPGQGEQGGTNRLAGPTTPSTRQSDPSDAVWAKLAQIDPKGEIVIPNTLGRGTVT